jgi:hypothetical protein
MEIILSVLLGVALTALAAWIYQLKTSLETTFNQMKIDFTEVLQEHSLHVSGFKDHITAMHVDIDSMQKELAEFTKNMDADILAKMQDRIAICELSSGVRRIDPIKRS